MRITLVVAMDEAGVIGADGDMPWHLPADLRHFKRVTLGKPVLMGRRTHESIGRPLPGRLNLVLTRDRHLVAPGCDVVHDMDQALAAAEGVPELMVIGGAEIFRLFLPRADRILLTRVHGRFSGDTWFPDPDLADWKEVSREDFPADARNPHAYSFQELERGGGASPV